MARRGKVKQVETRDVIDRPARSRKYRYLMLIVCEDENTERVYFEQFHKLFNDLLPSETVYIRAVGTGRNSLGVVNQAIIERNLLATEAGKKVDEVWAVFGLTEIQKYGNEVKAIERAVTLDEYHQKENHPPIEANPRTLVYKLVTQLRQWFAFYSYK